jgi:hypothetical protein
MLCSLFVTGLTPMPGATDGAVHVEVERPRLIADRGESPIVARFNLVFDARFANQSDAAVDIPDRDEPTGGAVGITPNGIESQHGDGGWKVVVNGGTLLWKSDTVFADCKSIGPKETVPIKGVSSPLVIYKSQLPGLGTRPTLRLALVLSCKTREGNVVLKDVVTSPFVLSIPNVP